MVPQTSRDLLTRIRPVISIMGGWIAVVLLSEFGIKNIGYHEPFSLIWWIGSLLTIAATVVALTAVVILVISQGIALGLESADSGVESTGTHTDHTD